MMTRRYELRLPVPPSANRWARLGNGHLYTPAKVLEYQAAVKVRAIVAKCVMIRPPATVAVAMTWYRGRRSGDLDRRIGIALDALQGLVYENDAQVVELHAYRRDDRTDPRLMVTIEEVA
jgi:Holliday junction resolvase RusA-like endonuclease